MENWICGASYSLTTRKCGQMQFSVVMRLKTATSDGKLAKIWHLNILQSGTGNFFGTNFLFGRRAI